MYNIEWEDLLNKSSVNIIDIRSSSNYLIGHINNSINISELELVNNHYKYLNKKDIYYIYCDYGNRSKRVVFYLNNLGYNTVNINGGYYNFLLRK